MRIKITQATKGFIPSFMWYANRIGETFEVSKDSPTDEDGVYVIKDEPYSRGFVYHEDYTNVSTSE